MASIISNHVMTHDPESYPEVLRPYMGQLEGRSTLVRKLEMLPVECVARGYLSGSGFGQNLGAVIILVILTGAFCIIFWLLKIVKSSRQQAATG